MNRNKKKSLPEKTIFRNEKKEGKMDFLGSDGSTIKIPAGKSL